MDFFFAYIEKWYYFTRQHKFNCNFSIPPKNYSTFYTPHAARGQFIYDVLFYFCPYGIFNENFLPKKSCAHSCEFTNEQNVSYIHKNFIGRYNIHYFQFKSESKCMLIAISLDRIFFVIF